MNYDIFAKFPIFSSDFAICKYEWNSSCHLKILNALGKKSTIIWICSTNNRPFSTKKVYFEAFRLHKNCTTQHNSRLLFHIKKEPFFSPASGVIGGSWPYTSKFILAFLAKNYPLGAQTFSLLCIFIFYVVKFCAMMLQSFYIRNKNWCISYDFLCNVM